MVLRQCCARSIRRQKELTPSGHHQLYRPPHPFVPPNEGTFQTRMTVMRIEKVKDKYEQQLMQLPNVTGVGIGEKDGKPVIKVFVTRKVAESSLRPHEVIPKQLEGHQTDVEEIGVVTSQVK